MFSKFVAQCVCFGTINCQTMNLDFAKELCIYIKSCMHLRVNYSRSNSRQSLLCSGLFTLKYSRANLISALRLRARNSNLNQSEACALHYLSLKIHWNTQLAYGIFKRQCLRKQRSCGKIKIS